MSTVIPKAEYPRPDRDRSERWLSLNGQWQLESSAGAQPITVPFAWETAASGVGRTWLEEATYRRTIEVPAWGDSRVFLCFGAVHHRATVSIDGVQVGTHQGGYTSFEFDVTGIAAGTVELVVEVEAPADKRELPHGKQRSIPRDDYDGVSFTPTSGIWQSVWLEARGRTWVSALELRGDSLQSIEVRGMLSGDAPAGAAVTLAAAGDSVTLVADGDGSFSGSFVPASPSLWSPADPHLYELLVTAADDRLLATAGLRSIEARGEELYLNGERLYLRGVLDQGYWPASGPTAPTDAALREDLELARDAGYNLVRKHLKFEEARFFDHADRMGLLVWAEPASTSRFTAASAAAFEEQIAPMVERDGNHPSVIIWGLYNEEWGLDWDIPGSASRAAAATRAYDLLRALDSTRPIVENSGWSHVRSDLVDWHYYDEDPASWAANLQGLADGSRHDWPVKLGPDFVVDKSLYGSADFPRTGVPIVNSEYGAGFTSLERAWSLRWQTQELRRHDRFAGYVYTELADVEHEAAGLFDADRRRKDWGGLDPADANAETVIVVDLVPRHAGADIRMPAAPLELDVHVSHHGAAALGARVHAAWAPAGERFGGRELAATTVTEAVVAQPFALSPAVTVRVAAPLSGASGRLMLWLVDETGAVRARTFVDAGPIEEPNRRGARVPS
jgi:hypothetical protein